MRRYRYVVLVLLMTCGCEKPSSFLSQEENRRQSKLLLTGSSTVAPLAAELAKRFEQMRPDVRIDVQTGGSGKGIADTRRGIADIGMASRSLKEDERDLTSHQIAADGICLIVHKFNPVDDLSDQQVADIYEGRIDNWKTVGGVELPITVVHKAEGRATLEVFLEYFGLDNLTVQADVVIGDNEHGVKTVAGDPGAIGYVSIGTAEANSQAGVPIKLLAVGGVAASMKNVASGDFPVSRPLNLITNGEAGPLATNFIRFCQSEQAHEIILEQHFVPAGD